MRAKVLIALCIIGIASACSKDKFTTRPQLEFKSVNGSVYVQGSQLEFVLRGTDREGDLKDSLWVQRISLSCPDLISDTAFPYPLPDFVKKNHMDVEFVVDYLYKRIEEGYVYIDGCVGKDDSSYFRFWIKDNENNTSDTVQSPLLYFMN